MHVNLLFNNFNLRFFQIWTNFKLCTWGLTGFVLSSFRPHLNLLVLVLFLCASYLAMFCILNRLVLHPTCLSILSCFCDCSGVLPMLSCNASSVHLQCILSASYKHPIDCALHLVWFRASCVLVLSRAGSRDRVGERGYYRGWERGAVLRSHRRLDRQDDLTQISLLSLPIARSLAL